MLGERKLKYKIARNFFLIVANYFQFFKKCKMADILHKSSRFFYKKKMAPFSKKCSHTVTFCSVQTKILQEKSKLSIKADINFENSPKLQF
jgi:hypothetical protein